MTDVTPSPIRSPLGQRPATGFLRAVGFSAFGLLGLLLPSSVLAGEVTLAWDPSQDPNLAGYRIYYGYAKGSYEGVLDAGMETTYTLTDLEEGQPYYFALVAYDSHGEESELSQEVAYNGPPTDYEADADESAVPNQDEADQAASESESVLDAAGEMDADEPDTTPALEQDAEDDQDQDHERSEASTDLHVIPQPELSIASVDSETLVGDGAADSAIDDRVETFWHTERGARASVHPHELVIALGREYMVSGFRYLPRQDGKTDGMVGRYSFYVSEDGKGWGKAVTTGTFSRDIAEQEVTFPGKVGSFVRFVAHSEVNGKPWTSVAELNVLGVRSFR
jgi:F5/8 type C domain/Fibronectin type III domain